MAPRLPRLLAEKLLFDNNKNLQNNVSVLFSDKECNQMKLASILTLAVILALSIAPAFAAPSTSRGQISVAQVLELLEKSSSDSAARNAVVGYLAGVGETAGLLMADERVQQAGLVKCRTALSLADTNVVAAFRAAAPDRASWEQTAATPIILVDMFTRAGCR
jgi:hypothetical protein